MPVALAAPLFLASLAVTLVAARLFAGRLDAVGVRLGLPEAAIGLLTALAADGPEITSALIAVAKGAGGVGVGVVIGSNAFNLAAMLGVSAVLAGAVRLPRRALVLEGVAGAGVTLIAAAELLGWLASLPAALLTAAVLVPYLVLAIRRPPARHHAGAGAATGVVAGRMASAHDRASAHARRQRRALPHVLALIALDVTLIVAGSFGMVQSALVLGTRWGLARALLGVLILAPLTSIPNALTGVRLGRAGRGTALVGETFDSNTLNLAAGIVAPALFLTVGAVSGTARLELAWLVGMTAIAIALLARRRGADRLGGVALIALYAGFVAIELLGAG